MKSTGIVRKLDELGRITLPIELRKVLGITGRDALQISLENDRIVLTKYEPACIFCNNAEGVQNYKGKLVCTECVKKMVENLDQSSNII